MAVAGSANCDGGCQGEGNEGGARVIYYWKRSVERLFLLFLYPKNVQADLTTAQLRKLRALVADEE